MCVKFQVIPFRDFHFILLTHTPTHIPTLYYAVGADNYWRPCDSDAQSFDINTPVSDNYQSINITH